MDALKMSSPMPTSIPETIKTGTCQLPGGMNNWMKRFMFGVLSDCVFLLKGKQVLKWV